MNITLLWEINRQNDLNYADLLPGQYICCMYDKKWYVGCIVDRSESDCDVYISLMEKKDNGQFSWPDQTRKNECWIPFQNIVCLISAPELKGQSARLYKLSEQDTAQIKSILLTHI